MSARSERVKYVDIHPTEPWVAAALYTGHLYLWDYSNETLIKTFQVCAAPLRIVKFVPRKQWIVCGSDDMNIRVYNYNTMEKIMTFEAHIDYIRSISIHPHSPYMVSSSDDMTIKVWDWERNWKELRVFEGHTHYVMQVQFNPKDPGTFASASLDRTVKVWGITSPNAHFTLEGHERGVNCVSYFNGDRPFLLSGADDMTVRIWDYQTKSCVAVLEGHTNNISAVVSHPSLPLILSASEDGSVRLWHSTTYRHENTLNYGMDRVWSLASARGSGKVAIGCDDGTVVVQMGQEEPVVSMDRNGKIIFAQNQELIGAATRSGITDDLEDGERMQLAVKDMGRTEIYPHSIHHDPKGRLLAVCGDGEYIILTALSLKNKTYGSALEFVWASHASGVFATRESTSKITIFKNFKEHQQFRPLFPAEGIFGGALLGVRSSEFIDFYDWEECRIVRRIELTPHAVYWSDSGEVVVLLCDSCYYVLRLNRELVSKYVEQDVGVGEQGIDDAFEMEKCVNHEVMSGSFVGDCFIYTTSNGKLNYMVGGDVITLAHLEKGYFLLGYLTKENRVYLTDRNFNVISYSLLVSVLAYQTAIVREDFDAAEASLEDIPQEQYSKLAKFLEMQGHLEMALDLSQDMDHRFELSLKLGQMDLAYEIANAEPSDLRWKQLGDLALSKNDLELTSSCYEKATDLGGLLLLSTSNGNADRLLKLGTISRDANRFNVAFLCFFLLHRCDDCLDMLIKANRIPEAAFFARTYLPSRVSTTVKLWKDSLQDSRPRIAEALCDPEEHPDMFPNFDHALQVESSNAGNAQLQVASSYAQERLDMHDAVEQADAVVEDMLDLNALDHDVDQEPVVEPEMHSEADYEEDQQYVEEPAEEEEEQEFDSFDDF